MTVSTSGARHLLLTLPEGARLPDALLAALRDEVVLGGWMRASGVLADVQLRALDPRAAGQGAARRIAGAVQAVTLEGSIGMASGDVSCGMRAVLAREGELGHETFAGDIVEARVVALEVLVTAFDDVTAERRLDRSGVWIAEASGASAGANAPAARPAPPPQAAPSEPRVAPATAPSSPSPAPAPTPAATSFSDVVRAGLESPPPAPAAPPPPAAPAAAAPPRPSPTFSVPGGMPMKPVRPVQAEEEEQQLPDAGDTVEHFAFGRCEVVKTDGDRLHVRLGKDGRIKEIALEMLKVSPLPPAEGQTSRHWKLARKL